MNNDSVLTMKDLLNFEYCKRIFYFERVLRDKQVTTVKEFEGRKKHVEADKKSSRNKIVRELPRLEKKYGIRLFSEKLNFATVADCVLVDGQTKTAYPVQFKNTITPPVIYNTMRKQVVLEGLLLQEQFGYSVSKGFINFLLSKEIVEVEIDDYSKESVIRDLGQMRELLEAEKFPEKTDSANKCRDCCFRNYC